METLLYRGNIYIKPFGDRAVATTVIATPTLRTITAHHHPLPSKSAPTVGRKLTVKNRMASRFYPSPHHGSTSDLLLILSAEVLEFMAAVRVRLIFSTNQSNRDEYNAFATASRADAAT